MIIINPCLNIIAFVLKSSLGILKNMDINKVVRDRFLRRTTTIEVLGFTSWDSFYWPKYFCSSFFYHNKVENWLTSYLRTLKNINV